MATRPGLEPGTPWSVVRDANQCASPPHCGLYLQNISDDFYKSLRYEYEIGDPDLGYRKVPKFPDARKLFCNLPKTQTNRPNLRVFRQNNTN